MKENNLSVSFALLRSRRFGTFWFASLLSNIGTWVQQVAQPWLLLSLNASSFLIGLDSFALGAPGWLLTLVGGMLADRSDRRRVITQFQSIQMLCPVLLVILLLFGSIRPWMIILLSLVVGITDALSMPSFQSIVPSIVARNQIPAGLALNSTQFNLSRIMGPAIAGVLLVGIGAAGCFAVSALSYIPFIVVALWILPSRPKKSRIGRGDGSKMWTDSKKIFPDAFFARGVHDGIPEQPVVRPVADIQSHPGEECLSWRREPLQYRRHCVRHWWPHGRHCPAFCRCRWRPAPGYAQASPAFTA